MKEKGVKESGRFLMCGT